MLRLVTTVDVPGVLPTLIASFFLSTPPCTATAAPPAGPVTGVIDAVRYEGDQFYVFGWACQGGNRSSIDVHVYAGHAAGGTPPGTFVTAGTADIANEPAVDRECHDANGGKHRFRIALPNQLLRSFQKKSLFAHGIAVAGNMPNAAIAGSGKFQFPVPKWRPDPPTPAFIEGPQVAAFDTRKESCEQIDIPDAAARAFRDYKGMVHLIASHHVTRAGLGPTLETAKHNCQVVFASHYDSNPADFDDYTWLTPFYAIDGKRIFAVGHMEYHGWEHPGMCASKTDGIGCAYVVETFNLSEDGGYHFTSPMPPANYLLGLPYKYEVNRGISGYSVDTNIVKAGNWYYALMNGWPWPPNCGDKGQPPCRVPGGACPIRTANLLDSSSWRGWDGKDFTVRFVDPYRGPVADPQAHVCVPVDYANLVTGINVYAASHRFVATLWDDSGALGAAGVYFSSSTDFVHWSKPALAMTLNQMLRREPEGNWRYLYFSLIDPNAGDANFTTITDHPYLYYVRLDDNHGPYQRVLFRQRVKLDWLLRAAESTQAAH